MKLLVIILCIILLIILFRKKLINLVNSDIEGIKDINYTNDEIKFLVAKYSDLDSEHLLKIIEEESLTDNEFRAIRKVLGDRNFIIPHK